MSPREDDITGWFRQQRDLSPVEIPIGIGDDMAQIALSRDSSVLITTDMLLDGTHFLAHEAGLKRVGYKSMAASLSDCAAMATIPIGAVVAVGLPRGFSEAQMKELHSGILLAADKYRCPLVGGDITSWQDSGRLVVCVSMLSKPGGKPPVRRSGAGWATWSASPVPWAAPAFASIWTSRLASRRRWRCRGSRICTR